MTHNDDKKRKTEAIERAVKLYEDKCCLCEAPIDSRGWYDPVRGHDDAAPTGAVIMFMLGGASGFIVGCLLALVVL